MRHFFDTDRASLRLLFVLCLLKLAWLIVDPTIRYFMGDSASYIYSATYLGPPGDRSVLYPALIWLVATLPRTLYVLIFVQTLFGVLTCWIAFIIMRDLLRVTESLAASVTCLFAVEPSQLLYERMVMTDSVTLFLLALMSLWGLQYAAGGQLSRLALVPVVGILAVAMRVATLPFVVGFALSIIVARFAYTRPLPKFRMAFQFAIVVLVTAILHLTYVHAFSKSAHMKKRDYIVHAGLYRLSLVSPIVTSKDLAAAGAPSDMLDRVDPKPTAHNRDAQIYAEHGIVQQLRREVGEASAEHISYKIAAHALRRNWPAFLIVQLETLKGYFSRRSIEHRLYDDLGAQRPDSMSVANWKRDYGYDASEVTPISSVAARYFFYVAPWWLPFCLFALVPLAIIALTLTRAEKSGAILALAFAAVGMVASNVLFTHIICYRYLQPFPFFLMIICAVIVDRLMRLRTGISKSARSHQERIGF